MLADPVSRLRDTCVRIWHNADPATTIDGPAYTPAEHERNEVELGALVNLLTRESRRAGRRAAHLLLRAPVILGVWSVWTRTCSAAAPVRGPATGVRFPNPCSIPRQSRGLSLCEPLKAACARTTHV